LTVNYYYLWVMRITFSSLLVSGKTSVEVQTFSVFFKPSEVEELASLSEGALASEASDSHVRWLVSLLQSLQPSGVRLAQSIMEWLRLVELLSVLGSLLVGVHVRLGCPRGRVPQLIADNVP